MQRKKTLGGETSNTCLCFTLTNVGIMIQFDKHMFQMGWSNHQQEKYGRLPSQIIFL